MVQSVPYSYGTLHVSKGCVPLLPRETSNMLNQDSSTQSQINGNGILATCSHMQIRSKPELRKDQIATGRIDPMQGRKA